MRIIRQLCLQLKKQINKYEYAQPEIAIRISNLPVNNVFLAFLDTKRVVASSHSRNRSHTQRLSRMIGTWVWTHRYSYDLQNNLAWFPNLMFLIICCNLHPEKNLMTKLAESNRCYSFPVGLGNIVPCTQVSFYYTHAWI